MAFEALCSFLFEKQLYGGVFDAYEKYKQFKEIK